MTLFYRDRSKIHGFGCFAGCHVFFDWSVHVPSALIGEPNEHSVGDDDGNWYRLYSPYRFLNHSETPNSKLIRDKGGWVLRFFDDIEKGEEVTIDYGREWHT